MTVFSLLAQAFHEIKLTAADLCVLTHITKRFDPLSKQCEHRLLINRGGRRATVGQPWVMSCLCLCVWIETHFTCHFFKSPFFDLFHFRQVPDRTQL